MPRPCVASTRSFVRGWITMSSYRVVGRLAVSFAQCAPLVKAGKPVKYVGPGGPTSFDSFHDSTGIFQIDTYTPGGQVKTVGTISPAQLRALSG